MKKDFNILVTAASRRVAMIRGFSNALKKLGVNGNVVCTDTDSLSTGLRFCDRFHLAPLSNSGDYISALLKICKKENISMLVPTIDEELEIFGRHKKDFAGAGVILLVSDEKVGRTCRDKYLTAQFFNEHGFPFAETYLPENIDHANIGYPLFIKPRWGRGSVGAHMVQNETELRFFSGYVEKPVVQRYLYGKEYTIDVLAGLDGQILSVVPRERMIIRAGVCDRGRTVHDDNLIKLSSAICEKLGVIGPVNLQCKVDNGTPCFFEVNPRFSGAIQLTVAAGADFFSMIIQDAIGRKPRPDIGNFQDGLLMLSYEESIFENGGGMKAAVRKTAR